MATPSTVTASFSIRTVVSAKVLKVKVAALASPLLPVLAATKAR